MFQLVISMTIGTFSFSGIYDGKNHYIQVSSHSELSNYQSHGIFGSIDGATVKNLTVKGSFSNGAWSGGIAGISFNSTILNCKNESTNRIGEGGNRGGIAGSMINSTIQNCVNTAIVRGSYDVGGIAGVIGENGSSSICLSCNLRKYYC